MATRTLLTAVLGAATMVAGAACGTLPLPGGHGDAAPEARDPAPAEAAAESPESVTQAVVQAWDRGDRAAADPLTSRQAAEQLFSRRYPDPPPALVVCGPHKEVAEGVACFFATADRGFTLVVQRRAAGDGWEVTSAKFHAA